MIVARMTQSLMNQTVTTTKSYYIDKTIIGFIDIDQTVYLPKRYLLFRVRI
jgi:hypothetical protein